MTMRPTISLAYLLLLASTATAATYDIRDYGAIPNNGISDGHAIRDAVSAANAAGGGTVYIPDGTWDVTNDSPDSNISIGQTVHFYQMRGITVLCQSWRSVIKVQAKQYPGDYYVFRINDSDNIDIRGCTLDGNRWQIVSPSNEQLHLFEVQKSRDVKIVGNQCLRPWGDCLRVYGEWAQNKPAERISFIDNHVEDTRRNGITIQRDWIGGDISGNTFRKINDGALDFEPTGCTRPESCTGPIRLRGNWIYQAPTSSARTNLYIVTLWNASNIEFSSNYVEGELFIGNLRHSRIIGNSIDARYGRSDTEGISAIGGIRRVYYVTIAQNNIQCGTPDIGISLGYNNAYWPVGNTIADNQMIGCRVGVHMTGPDWTTIKGNQMTVSEFGVYYEQTRTSTALGLRVENNDIRPVFTSLLWGVFVRASKGSLKTGRAGENTIIGASKAAVSVAATAPYTASVAVSETITE